MRLAALGNQYVADQEPWAALESDKDRAATILYVALRAVDNLKVLLTPYLPFSSQRLHEMLGYDGYLAGPLEFHDVDEDGTPHVVLTGDYAGWVGTWAPSALTPGQQLREPRPLFVKLDPEKVVADELDRMQRSADEPRRARSPTPTQRDRLARAPGRVRRAGRRSRGARARGRRDAHRHVGTGIDSCRAALALADENDGVFAALGIDPHQAASPEAARVDELRELLEHPKAVAVGETGLDNARRYATPEEQRRLFDEQLALADDLGLPVVVHTREANSDTAAALAGFTGTVVMHCFSEPGLLETVLDRRLLRVLRR